MYASFRKQSGRSSRTVLYFAERRLDMAEAAENALKSYGVSVITGAGLKEIKEGTAVYTKNGEEDTLDGDAILLATGRGPNTEGLHAERAGVELTKRAPSLLISTCGQPRKYIWAAGARCVKRQKLAAHLFSG
ncbi:MAG: FAD-dependent oxidoreductase [Dialister invisus]